MREVKLKLDKTYTLAFGTKALRRFERESGRTLDSLAESFGVDMLVSLVHAGMVYHHPEMTDEDVEAAIDAYLEAGGDIVALAKTVGEGISGSGWAQNPTEARSSKGSGKTPAE